MVRFSIQNQSKAKNIWGIYINFISLKANY